MVRLAEAVECSPLKRSHQVGPQYLCLLALNLGIVAGDVVFLDTPLFTVSLAVDGCAFCGTPIKASHQLPPCTFLLCLHIMLTLRDR